MIRFFSLLIIAISLTSCSIVDPLVYKLPKQQGNITEYEELEKLEIGMNKAQVKFIMGTPLTISTFNQDRWNYTYTYKSAAGDLTRNKLFLYFQDGKLSKIEGEPLIKRDEESKKPTGQS